MAKTLMVTNESGHRLNAAIRTAMEAAAGGALVAGGLTGDLSRLRVDVTLVSDEDLRELSRQHLGVDHYTDVMSFSQIEGDDAPAVRGGPRVSLLGDIVISYDRAAEQAARADHPLATELALLVAHGVLHLLGHDDQTATDAALMRQRERQALEHAGVHFEALPAQPE